MRYTCYASRPSCSCQQIIMGQPVLVTEVPGQCKSVSLLLVCFSGTWKFGGPEFVWPLIQQRKMMQTRQGQVHISNVQGPLAGLSLRSRVALGVYAVVFAFLRTHFGWPEFLQLHAISESCWRLNELVTSEQWIVEICGDLEIVQLRLSVVLPIGRWPQPKMRLFPMGGLWCEDLDVDLLLLHNSQNLFHHILYALFVLLHGCDDNGSRV